jgi:hypothetical protein
LAASEYVFWLEEKIVVQIATPRRSLASMAWLLVVGISLLAGLALGNTIVLLAALTAALLSGWLLRRQVPALASSSPGSTNATSVPRAQRGVWTADGTQRQAQVLPVSAVDGYQTVLTIDGYALVNAQGRVVYALGSELYAQTSEPVVVTIFDDEIAAFDEKVAVR